METTTEQQQSEVINEQCPARFTPELEAKLIKALSGLLSGQVGISEDKAVSMPLIMVLDPANVAGVVAKSQEAKRLIARFVDPERLEQKIPEYNYITTGSLRPNTAKYSFEYLSKILAVFKCFETKWRNDSGVLISVARDYPGMFENEHFSVILAPRVDTHRVDNDGAD